MKIARTFLIACAMSCLLLPALTGCAGGPMTVEYSVYQGWARVSDEVVQYDGRGAHVVSEDGLDPSVASGFRKEMDMEESGLVPFRER